MQYGCRDNTTEDFLFEKCWYYIKFTPDRRIKYEVAHGCPLAMQIKRVVISNTDYENFILIRGCVIQKGKNDIILEREHLMILLKRKLDKNSTDYITNFIRVNRTKQNVRLFLHGFYLGPASSYCNCKNSTCRSNGQHLCHPMEYLKPELLYLNYYIMTIAIIALFVFLFLVYIL